nr:MAG TPA: hypothetical protein [Caudoviricetes sp.]
MNKRVEYIQANGNGRVWYYGKSDTKQDIVWSYM